MSRKAVFGVSILLYCACPQADVTGHGAHVARTALSADDYEPTSQHVKLDIYGFSVQFSSDVMRQAPAEAESILRLIRAQLAQVSAWVPAAAVASLRDVVIWVSRPHECEGVAAYHPSADWLHQHGFNPDMGESVEICGSPRFLKASEMQPSIVLHELAHAYHHQFLENGFHNEHILAAFRAAQSSGRYREVLDWFGDAGEHYALTNQMEFFAELTEAYFSTNDAYPFVRPELQEYDPESVDAIERAWGFTATWTACELEGEIRSRNGVPVRIEVANATEWPRSVQWIDYDGNRDARGATYLEPGASAWFLTSENHPAVVLSDSGRCLAVYTPGRVNNERIEIRF